VAPGNLFADILRGFISYSVLYENAHPEYVVPKSMATTTNELIACMKKISVNMFLLLGRTRTCFAKTCGPALVLAGNQYVKNTIEGCLLRKR
jgi:hypothetical protein